LKQNYKLFTKTLQEDIDVSQYRELLQRVWNNNAYYAIEHLLYFENKSNTLRYFLLEKEEEPVALMPFILRKVESTKLGATNYYDTISPYGYNGPLFKDDIENQDIAEFWKQVDTWYYDNNVISEFIRFSLTDNHLGYTGNLIKTLSNVKGKLCDDFENQWVAFLPKVRNNFRRASNYNLRFQIFSKESITKEVISTFTKIYVNTMKRNNADSLYFFSDAYFENLIFSNINNFSIAIAYFEETPISVELIIDNKETYFAFLGGTDAEYFSHRPNDFLRVKIIEWAIDKNKRYYVLGGGMKDGDGLYKSKKSFFPKDDDVIFYTGRKVVNQKVYDALSVSVNDEYSKISKQDLDSCFFPFYRSNP